MRQSRLGPRSGERASAGDREGCPGKGKVRVAHPAKALIEASRLRYKPPTQRNPA